MVKKRESDILGFFGNLVLVLEQNPNMEHAICFTFDHLDDENRKEFQKLASEEILKERELSLRNVTLKKEETHRNVVDLLERTVNKRDSDERRAILDKALENMLYSSRIKIIEFSEKIKLPSFVVFGVGILVPLVLILLFPTISFLGGKFALIQLGVIYCMVLPICILVITEMIDRDRPRCIEPPPIDMRPSLVLLVLPLLTIITIIAILRLWGETAVFPAIWLSVLSFASVLFMLGINPFKTRLNVGRAEEELPDFLLEMGTQLNEGKPLERALMNYGENGNTPLKSAVKRAWMSIAFDGKDIREALLSEFSGRLPSKTIRSGLMLLLSAGEKGNPTAGRTMIRISKHMQKVLEVRREIKNALSDLLTTMRSLAVFFAPILTAFTARIYDIMTRERSIFFNTDVTPIYLTTILAIYTVILAALLVDYSVRLEYGRDSAVRCVNVAIAMVLALAVFTVSWLAGGMLFASLLS